MDNFLEFTFTERLDWYFFNFIDINEVDKSINIILVVNSFSLRVDNTVLLFSACYYPS
jgi:hypothetical protein